MRRTKIVCTLGPSVSSPERIAELIHAGMNVARINCSHGDWDMRSRWIQWIRDESPVIAPVAILADLQGPKFRIGPIQDGNRVIQNGEVVIVGDTPIADIYVPSPAMYSAMEVGDKILLGDGEVSIMLISKANDSYEAVALSGGIVKSRQGLTLVGKHFEVPAITDQDKQDIIEACHQNVDFIALSYVRKAEDMNQLRALVNQHSKGIHICAKIENSEALQNIESIIDASDLIMVARGDLGLQMEIEDVPLAQKKIINKCAEMGMPVITATQMLESMVHAARPTRAEATDVANAVLDGTDAVMLSGETAAGDYPIEAVKVMAKIAEKAETQIDFNSRLTEISHRTHGTISQTESVALAAVHMATSLRAKAILTTTSSGFTSRMVTKYRPKMPVFCTAWNLKTANQMAVVNGVVANYMPSPHSTDENVEHGIEGFVKAELLKKGDTIVVTAGIPAGVPGNSNLIMVKEV